MTGVPVRWPPGALGEDGARRLAEHVLAAARERRLHVSVAVCDDSGVLLAFARMDGAAPFSAELAVGKARTAAAFAAPTQVLEELWSARPTYAHSAIAAGGYFLGRGGVPVLRGDVCVGGVGVSGSEPEVEEELALDATQALGEGAADRRDPGAGPVGRGA